MARGPHCGQYSIKKGGSQEWIKKWGKEREKEGEGLLGFTLGRGRRKGRIFSVRFSAGVVFGFTPGFTPGLEIFFSPNFFHFLLVLIPIFELSLLLLQSLGVSHGRDKAPFLVPAIGMNLGSLGGLSAGLPRLSG